MKQKKLLISFIKDSARTTVFSVTGNRDSLIWENF